MKTIKTLVAIIGMVACLAISQTNAQVQLPTVDSGQTISVTPPTGGDGGGSHSSGGGSIFPIPNQLPISMADLQAKMWESIAKVGVYGQAENSIYATTNDQTQVWLSYLPAAGVVDIDEIFALVKAQRMQLSTLRQSDTIGLGAGLYDQKGNNLIYANVFAKINPPENGVSENTLDLVFNLGDSTWLKFTGAVGFRIVERDENNNPIRYWYAREYDIQDGRIRFPLYYSDKNGEIVVQLTNGTEVAYSLGNRGKRIIPTTVSLGIGNVSALGMRTFRGTNAIYVEVSLEEFRQNINPLSQVVIDKEGYYYFAAWFDELWQSPSQSNGIIVDRYASAVRVWRQGQISSTTNPIGIPGQPAAMYLQPGYYWAEFGFKGWPVGNQFNPPYQDMGGMGGGGEVTLPVVEGK